LAAGCVVFACGFLSIPGHAQNQNVKVSITPRTPRHVGARGSGVFRADVNRVFIATSVTDLYGRPVEGLKKEDFRLLESGVEQPLAEFFVEDGPISIGIVMDGSASMRNKIVQTRKAVSEFLRLSSRDDELFLVSFQDRPELMHAFTTNVEEIEADLEKVQPNGWTALYDGMVLALNYMKKASRTRRVLLILSDGADNNSRYSEAETRNLVREADVRIFSVSVQSSTPALDKMAAESGGRAYRVSNLDELPEVAVKLSAEAHAQYMLGFNPQQELRDGKYRTVKVEVVQPDGDERFRVAWRRGYYAPLD
jgi:Ca-activated chloride channel family protein